LALTELNELTAVATLGIALATLVLAGVTACMVSKTKQLARETAAVAQETAALVAQEDRHHKERFTPVCVLVPQPPRGSDSPRSQLVRLSGRHVDSVIVGGVRREWRFCEVACAVHNAGVGPALNVVMVVRFLGDETHEAVYELSPLGSGQTLDPASSPGRVFVVPVEMIAGISGQDLERAVSNGAWEIYLRYSDVFGDVFHTKHTADPEQPWTVFKKGDRRRGGHSQ